MPTCHSTFLNENLRKQRKKTYPAVGLSNQMIDEAQSHQQEFLLVGTDIAFVVINSTLCQYGALLYGAYR